MIYKAYEAMFEKLLTENMKNFIGKYKYIIEEDDFGLIELGIKTEDDRKYFVSNITFNDDRLNNKSWLNIANEVLIDCIKEDMNAKMRFLERCWDDKILIHTQKKVF